MKCCAAVKSCAEKLILNYFQFTRINVPHKKNGIGISCTNGKNLKPKCKSSVWSTTFFKNVVNVKNILCNVFFPFISFCTRRFFLFELSKKFRLSVYGCLVLVFFFHMLQLIIIIYSKFDELKNYSIFTYTVEND